MQIPGKYLAKLVEEECSWRRDLHPDPKLMREERRKPIQGTSTQREWVSMEKREAITRAP